MGRWAQRQRAGGGTIPLNYITRITAVASDTVAVQYARTVVASALDATDFESNPNNNNGLTITQETPFILNVLFDADIDMETGIRYVGSTAGFQTPDSIDF